MASRRRKRKHRARPKRPGNSVGVELVLESVELARGYDGPLRGRPEPRLLIVAYRVTPNRAVTLGRHLSRVEPSSIFPQRIELNERAIAERIFAGSTQEERGTLVVLAVALEEDAGSDVADVYVDLAQPERWAVWDPTGALPEPRPIEEQWKLLPSIPPTPDVVSLLRDGAHLEQVVRRDDWVGASALRVPLGAASRARYRLHFASADARNDWTANLHVRVSP